MQVNVVKSRSEREHLKVIPFTTAEAAFREALRIAQSLYAHRVSMPRVRTSNHVYILDNHDGIREGYKKANSVDLEAYSRLIAKGRVALEEAETELKGKLHEHSDDVAAAVLSGAAQSGDMVGTLNSIMQDKEVELKGIFKGVIAPSHTDMNVYMRNRSISTTGITIDFDSAGRTRISISAHSVEEKLAFLKTFKQTREMFEQARVALMKPPPDKEAS